MQPSGSAASDESLIIVPNSHLSTVGVTTKSEVDTGSSCTSKNYRVVCEQKLELIRERSFQRRRKIRLADHVIIDAAKPE